MIALLLPLLFSPANDLTTRVDDALARWDRADSPGGALAVVRGDEVVLLKTFGAARLSPARPMTTTTPLYLASLAKPFTAACALHAAAAGKLDLDAPLTATFPELPEAYGAATLRQCLHHRSGVIDVYDLAVLADLGRAPAASNAAAIELLARVPRLTTSPGERFLYSNSGYVLLADAIRRGTGQDLADYAREHLFEPMGMERARYGTDSDMALAYGKGGAGWVAREMLTGLTGPGGLVASIDDLVAFARAWHAGAWADEALRAELLSVPPGPRHPRLGGYAAGWLRQRLHGQEVQRHFGGAFGFSSDLIHVPALDLTVIALSNAADLNAADLAPTVLSWLVPEPEPSARSANAPQAGEVARLAGIWSTPDSSRVLVLMPIAGGLRAIGLGDLRVDLVPAGARRWEGTDVQAPFAIEWEGDSLRVEEDGVATDLHRVGTDALPQAEEVAGEYVNTALGARLTLVPGPRGSVRLEQHDPLLDLPPFMPMANGLLLCDRGAVLVVERDEDGAVTGLVGYANRAWGVRFERAR